VPESLKRKRILALDMGALVAGTKPRRVRGPAQAVLKEIPGGARRPGHPFIDELHTLVGAGAAEGAVDAANISSRRWRAAICAASAPPRSTSIAST